MRKGKPIVRKRARKGSAKNIEMTLQEAYDFFVLLKKTKGVRARTQEDYKTQFEFLTEWLADEHSEIELVSEINDDILREYIVYLSQEHVNQRTGEEGLSPYTVNIRIRFLKAFFNTLFSEEKIMDNPAENLSLMLVDEDSFDPLDDHEIVALLDAPDEDYYPQFRDKVAMLLMLDTGMRIGEEFALEIEEIDIKGRVINLPASKSKNRKARVIPISAMVAKMLLELISENKAHFDETHVFLSNSGTPYQPNSFRRRLLKYKKEAGITKRVSPHSLRHQFCRDYILNGGDVFTLQRIVGHADIQTTRKYIQMTGVDIKEQHALYSPVARLRKTKRPRN
ncbi:tyrosine recombinase XerC [Lederbergia ruris]|uniref:Tyrosine recombinase XerC n=1 Tax=Lederbergia ruris TaxID=217495 RepID=A0ABQ4KQJ4_9BACI|nr:tyrosine-type recombinase/integrase [Lederbergia ruris]GIN59776.1 tyrosine recombinase XerC [Lederbergia ruris]